MAYQVLARKWRPKNFQDVVGQKHIVTSLTNILTRFKIAQAYLFCGTRGVGKTSLARIFAKALRCSAKINNIEPCNLCPSCLDVDSSNSLDVLEIDGASNNSVENVRELIENTQYLPTSGQYKVYIIDEVHMLSTSAFNALLKVLEEPPKHVVFIFATTESHKIPETILSRLLKFDFKNISNSDLEMHVVKILKSENISYQNEFMIKRIVDVGRGSLRDTLSALDQVLIYGDGKTIKENDLAMALGLANSESISKICEAIVCGDLEKLSHLYWEVVAENVEIHNLVDGVLKKFYEVLQKCLLDKSGTFTKLMDKKFNISGLSSAEFLWMYESLSKDFIWIKECQDVEHTLEISLQKLALRRNFFQFESKNEIIENTEIKSEVKFQESESPLPSWDNFISYLNKNSPVIAANLEQGNILSGPRKDGNEVVINIGFDYTAKVFHDFLIDQSVHKKLMGFLNDFFKKTVLLNIKVLNEDQKKSSNFKSIVEEENIKLNQIEENKRSELMNSPLVKRAEEIFNSKIDKVILNK